MPENNKQHLCTARPPKSLLKFGSLTGALFVAATCLFSNPVYAKWTRFEFVIQNNSNSPATVEFKSQNCLQPEFLKEFIGKEFQLQPQDSRTFPIARRTDGACSGHEAVFSGRVTVKDKSYEWRTFRICCDGRMRPDVLRQSEPSVFIQTKNQGGQFVWQIVDYSPERSAAEKADLLKRYAPMIWLAKGEAYGPSSVDWAFPYLSRVPREGRWWLYPKQELKSPSDNSLPLFKGQGVNATAYGFWRRKTGGSVDLVYFTFYPYNRGKEKFNTVFGNHVGDWENVVVRLDGNLQPVAVFLSAHAGGQRIEWPDITKQETHPIVYAAKGSHGYYAKPGDHVYKETAVGDLVDYTSAGSAWQTWNQLATFDFDGQQSLDGNSWPRWMDTDYVVGKTERPGNNDPASGAIFRWGTGPNGCGGALKVYPTCRLVSGPTGPIDKTERWEGAAHCFPEKRMQTVWREMCN